MNIHEISYRACFKPQLLRFFLEMLTDPGDVVYDPFSGRGTTAVEAALLDRWVVANDVNPLSEILTRPRLEPPEPALVQKRLEEIPFQEKETGDQDLSMFFHERTLSEILSLRNYLSGRRAEGKEDSLDRWIRMVATNRLTGHSKGFFSVYSLPPNQAVSPEKQRKINQRRNQKPEYRDTRAIIKKRPRTF
ncbi:MAG: DNA methyltransferase [Thermodesulfobacteriota bacterium]